MISNIFVSAGSVACIGVGAQTAAGSTAAASVAAVRCGVSVFREHHMWRDRSGEHMVLASAPWLENVAAVTDRIVALATNAVQEAMQAVIDHMPVRSQPRVELHLALSRRTLTNDDDRVNVATRIARGVSSTIGTALRIGSLSVDGHVAGIAAVGAAVNALTNHAADLCIVLASDSWIDIDVLEALDSARQLHSLGQTWGFTPGEGAAALVLARRGHALSDVPVLALIDGVATAREENVLGSQSVCTAVGLSTAVAAVLSANALVGHTFCDLNGETYRADEFAFTMTRVSDRFADPSAFTAAASTWGDVGAASGLLSAIIPIVSWQRQKLTHAPMLIFGSSATLPLRGALVLSPPQRAAA